MNSAAVIGLGLIGGSLARDFAARGVRILAADRDDGAIERAIEDGVVAERLDLRSVDADVVVIAAPVIDAVAVLRELAAGVMNAPLVIDVGSAKSSIVAVASSLPFAERFIGCHPLAGDHRSGYEASRRGMFDGERVYVCPGARSSEESMKRAIRFWEELGSSAVVMDAAQHDRLMASVSHLPQIASSALANAIRSASIAPSDLGRGGRDMTRLAASSPELWTQLCLDNAEEISRALETYRETLAQFAHALEDRDAEGLGALFSEARGFASRL